MSPVPGAARAALLLAWCAFAGTATAARADDAVARGVQQYADADFAGAVRTLHDALDGAGLSRADLGRALGVLAGAEFALGDRSAMHEAVAALAVVEPGHTFGPEIPPEIRDTFEAALAVTEPPRLRIDVAASDGGEGARHVSVTLDGTTAGLREIALSCVDDQGRAATATGRSPSLDLTRGARCDARASWLGGVVLAQVSTAVGTSTAHAWDRARVASAPGADASRDAAASGPPWLWIGVGIGAAVAVVVLVIVVAIASASSGAGSYQLSPPVVAW